MIPAESEEKSETAVPEPAQRRADAVAGRVLPTDAAGGLRCGVHRAVLGGQPGTHLLAAASSDSRSIPNWKPFPSTSPPQ